jgi:TetR/AcrR family fatty acid metabolism transcriptional regulator
LSVPSRVTFPTERILETAGRLFGARRFHEVRMEDIAAEAEVGKGTLYRYFRDKEELYLALLERAAQQMTARIQAAITPVRGARARLVALVDTIIRFFDEHPHLLDLIQRAEVMRGHNMPWQQARDETFKVTLGLFEEGRQQGEFQVADPERGGRFLLVGLRSVLRFESPPRPPDLAERIIHRFLNGYNQRTS